MSDRVLISHVDLDGYGCRILAEKYLNPVASYHVDYDNLAPTLCDIPRDVHLFITDLSIPQSLAGLIEEFQDVTIIDHHLTSYWAREKYKHSQRIDTMITKRRCATWLLGRYLFDKGYAKTDLDWLDAWMGIIDDYDRFILEDPRSDMLNILLYQMSRDRFINDAQSMTPDRMIKNNKDRIDRKLRERREYIENAVVYEIPDLSIRTALVFAERFKSMLARDIYENRGYEVVFMLDMHNGQASIRSAPDSRVDCSELAKRLHPEGGGHFHASGFNTEDLTFLGGFSQIREAMKDPVLGDNVEEDEE